MTIVHETESAAARTRVFDRPTADRRSPREISRLRRSDVLALVGSIAVSMSLTGLVFRYLAPFSGPIAYVAVSYAVFLLVYALLVSFDEARPTVVDRLAAVAVHSLAAIVFLALASTVLFTAIRGITAVRHANFVQQDMRSAGPLDGLSVGGIRHGIIGTLIMTAITLVLTVPVGVTCAVFLNEFPGRFARFVRTIVEAMTALPSIIAGLFILATWILTMHMGRSGLAAALALAVMSLPIIIRSADVVIRLVPGTLREASYALGVGRWRTVWHVVLPTVRSGLATAVILGTARTIGETSPVLLTAGFTAAANYNPLSGPMVNLPLITFQFVKSSEPNMVARGFGSALTLFAVVLILFAIARILGGREAGQLSSRQRRRVGRRSSADLGRMHASSRSTTTRDALTQSRGDA